MATDRLDDPKLTHMIVSKLVPDRYKEMIRRTLKSVKVSGALRLCRC